MKHTTGVHQYATKTISIFLITFLLTSIIACKKEQLPSVPNRDVNLAAGAKKSLTLERILLNDSIVKMRCQNNLKQLGMAIHNYDDGSLKKQVAYEYDKQARLSRAIIQSKGYYLYEHDETGVIRKSGFYPDGYNFTLFTVEYSYNSSLDMNQWRTRFGQSTAGTAGGDGDDILIGGHTTYDYNGDGSVRSIAVFANDTDKEPMGKVLLQYNITPAQAAAWKDIANHFPEPQKPWEIISMLCNKIEMYGTGMIAGEQIVDGKIIYADRMSFNKDGYLLRKRTRTSTAKEKNGGPGNAYKFFSMIYE